MIPNLIHFMIQILRKKHGQRCANFEHRKRGIVRKLGEDVRHMPNPIIGRELEVVGSIQSVIAPDRRGEGLATELARAAIAVGFGPLGRETLVALTLPDNRASRRVMEKAGLGYERDVEHAGLPHVLYRIHRDTGEVGT